MPTATLTSKGQITVPLPVRRRLRLKSGDRLDFIFDPDGRVLLQPKRTPFESLRGILRRPGQKPVSTRAMDAGIEKAVRARLARASAVSK